jgi:hypothetical protein
MKKKLIKTIMYYSKLYFKSNLWIQKKKCDVEMGIPKFEILAPPLVGAEL